MNQLTLETMIAVFEEMMGVRLFWTLVGIIVVVTLAYLFVLIRDRSMSMRKFLWAQLSMPFGAIGAVLFTHYVTDSEFRDLGGPIDMIVMLVVMALGAGGIAVLVYTAQSLLCGSPNRPTANRLMGCPPVPDAADSRRAV